MCIRDSVCVCVRFKKVTNLRTIIEQKHPLSSYPLSSCGAAINHYFAVSGSEVAVNGIRHSYSPDGLENCYAKMSF